MNLRNKEEKYLIDDFRNIDNIINSIWSKTNKHIVCEQDIIDHLTRKGVMSYGNRKLSKKIAIFNLLAIVTCPICSDCKGTCYAKKAQNGYPSAWDKRLMLTWLALNNLQLLEKLICIELDKIVNGKAHKDVRYVRIHESGDFFCQAYVDMWTKIIAKYPTLRFYFYTKTNTIFDFSKMFALNNQKNDKRVNMVKSILPNGMINYGSIDYLNYVLQFFDYHVCPYGFTDNNGNKIKPHCGDCTICLDHEYVLFLDHYVNDIVVRLSDLRRNRKAIA